MLGCICLACPRKEQLFGTSWKRLALRSFVGLSVVGMVSSLWFLLCSTETIRGFLMVNTRANGTIFSSDSQAQELFARADARQKLRKKQLKNYCQQHFNQGLPWDRKQSLAHFLIDDENKFIYCAVPKVASTPLKMTLIRLRNESGLKITGSSAHNPKNWRHLSEYNATELSRRLDTHFKFLFVREPFHRLLSGYRDKFFGKNRFYTNYYRAMIVEAFRPQDLQAVATETNNVTFTEFLTYIISYSNAWSRNGHWRQVEHICFPCALEFDFIGHFETLEEDVASVLKKTGFDDRVTFPSIPTSRAASEFVKYFAQVPPEVIYRLGEHYWGDFAMFGYQFPGPLKSFLENYTHPS